MSVCICRLSDADKKKGDAENELGGRDIVKGDNIEVRRRMQENVIGPLAHTRSR